MTHKYDRVSKVIKEFLGEDCEGLNIRIGLKHGDLWIKDHADLVHFAYAVLEEFEKPDKDNINDFVDKFNAIKKKPCNP
jgi:hypothetical protein